MLKDSFEAIQAIIHKSISSLVQIIIQYYDLDSFGEEETTMFAEIKDVLRNLKQHYEDAKLIAQKQLELSGMAKYVCICPECGEQFLLRDDGVVCKFCGYEDDAESAAELYMENIMNMSAYSTIKNGGTMPIYDCPQCGYETLVIDSDNNCAVCFSCDYSCEPSELIFCAKCDQPFEGDEETGCICSSCLEQLVEDD